MQNIKNFVNGITGVDTQRKGVTNQTTSSMSIPRVDTQPGHGPSGSKYFDKVETKRNRTESECSNASVSSVMSSTSQKDKDSYFWVM